MRAGIYVRQHFCFVKVDNLCCGRYNISSENLMFRRCSMNAREYLDILHTAAFSQWFVELRKAILEDTLKKIDENK